MLKRDTGGVWRNENEDALGLLDDDGYHVTDGDDDVDATEAEREWRHAYRSARNDVREWSTTLPSAEATKRAKAALSSGSPELGPATFHAAAWVLYPESPRDRRAVLRTGRIVRASGQMVVRSCSTREALFELDGDARQRAIRDFAAAGPNGFKEFLGALGRKAA